MELKCDKLLSNVAVDCNLRHYILADMRNVLANADAELLREGRGPLTGPHTSSIVSLTYEVQFNCQLNLVQSSA